MSMSQVAAASVDLYWLPLGAGDNTHCVRINGRIFEAVAARYERRARCDLYHAALEVGLGDDRFVIEMAPVWSLKQTDRGVVCEGGVGLRWLGRSRLFATRCAAGETVSSRTPPKLSTAPGGSVLTGSKQRMCSPWSPPFLRPPGDATNSKQAVCGTPTR